MLIVETMAKIRRAYFSDCKSIKAICRELRLSRKVVRKVIRSGETSFSYERTVQPRPKLGQWTAVLDELLEANAAKPGREQHGRNTGGHASMSDRDDDLVPLNRHPIDFESRRHKLGPTKRLIHGADSPWKTAPSES